MDSKNEPLVPVTKKKVVKNEIKEEVPAKLWPPPPSPLGQMLAKNMQQWPYFKANPILALLRSSQIFGLLRPVNPPGLLDLPTILLLQNNLLNMLNNGHNRQVGTLFSFIVTGSVTTVTLL